MVSQDVPEVMDDEKRIQASKNPLFLSRSNKVVPREPIVETPEDAIKCFLSTVMDYLVLNTLPAKAVAPDALPDA